MSEFDDVPADLPPELEARIQKIMNETGLTRDEVITRQVKAFFREVDNPSPNAPALALKIRRAEKESGAGG
jgi:hypothetical protein